jgi:catechol 2,3-dioxygenase-like lactoylglutathione lyase family enzyme
MILGVHHVQITIPKGAEDEARKFYCELLGLPEIAKPVELVGRGGFWLAVGDRQVHVGTENLTDRVHSKAHVAYLVEDLEEWRAKLIQMDVPILEGIPIPGYNRFEFRDPFGNRVEFLESVSV